MINMFKTRINDCEDNTFELIVTVEEHNIIGGLGSAVSETLSKQLFWQLFLFCLPRWRCESASSSLTRFGCYQLGGAGGGGGPGTPTTSRCYYEEESSATAREFKRENCLEDNCAVKVAVK